MDINLHDWNGGTKVINEIRKLNYRDLIIFLIPFIIFLFYLWVFNPGILTTDSYMQLHQIAMGKFDSWHPFFHTFIEMLCLSIYPSTASVGVFQICIFSTMWMIICKYNRDEKNNKLTKIFVLQVILTLIISLIPINALYSITLWKDILFSYFMLLLCFLIKVMLDNKCQFSLPFAIIMALTMAVIVQIRHNGLYVVLLLLFVLAVYLYKKNQTQNIYITLPALTIIFILLLGSLNVMYDVTSNDQDAVFSKASHLLADYDLNLDLSEEDHDKINKLMPEHEIREKYNVYFQDTISYNANQTVYDNDKLAYITIAIKYSLENPVHFIQYLFESSSIVWDVTRDSDWKGSPYGEVTGDSARIFFNKYQIAPIATYENMSSFNVGTGIFNQLNSYIMFIKDNMLLETLFDSPALCMYLSIIILATIHILTKSKEIYLVYLPNMINIVIIFLSTPVQDNRYLYANLLIFYLLVIILIGVLFKYKYKGVEKSIVSENLNFIANSDNSTDDNEKSDEIPEDLENLIRQKILKELEREKQMDDK